MKFNSIIKKLINEDKRFDVLYDKFIKPTESGKSLIPFEIFKELIKMDPETTNVPQNFNWKRAKREDFENIKVGAGVNWLLRTYLKPKDFTSDYEPGTQGYEEQFKTYQHEILEDADMIKGLLDKHKKYQKRLPEDKRNIMNVDGVQELMNLPVKATASGETVPLREFQGKLASKAFDKSESGETSADSPQVRFSYPGSQILKVGSEYTLVKIPAGGELGQKAASFFGGYHLGSSNPGSNETNWCTSPENSHNFKNYIQQGPLYLFLANDDKGQVGIKSGLPKERYQIHFGSYRQYKDRLNGTFDFVSDLATGKFSEFKEFFKDEFKKGVGSSSFSTSKGNLEGEYIIKLNNPNPGATTDYIKIYGKEGLEKSDPNKMMAEQFENIPNNCTAIKIVNDTREVLFVDIPDSLLKLTGLKTINITNIAKSLPNDFSGFKSLKFLSLVNNPELKKIPDGLEKCPLVFINLMGSDNIVLSPQQLEHFEQDRDERGNIEEPYFWTPK